MGTGFAKRAAGLYLFFHAFEGLPARLGYGGLALTNRIRERLCVLGPWQLH